MSRVKYIYFLYFFLIIFGFFQSNVFTPFAYAEETFVNITSGLTFSNPADGNVCGWYPDLYNDQYVQGVRMYQGIFPDTSILNNESPGRSYNYQMSDCNSPGRLETGFRIGHYPTPDGRYWVKMTSAGIPFEPDWANGTSYYFEAVRENGLWSLVVPDISSEKSITAFAFESLDPDVAGVIDEEGHTVTLNVPFGTNITALVPTISVSAEASLSPNAAVAQDFTSSVTYTVTAEDDTTQDYVVTVNFVCTEDCYSNVMFLPGLMGSKLYKQSILCDLDSNINIGDCMEKELWVSIDDSLQSDLALDTNGKSVNSIYTKNDTQKLDEDGDETGIVDDAQSSNIYQSFITDLKNWKQDGTIQDYAFIPYDWRLSLDDVITQGHTLSDNRLSYKDIGQNFSESFILQKLEALQANSKSGKVTIIAHSEGGFVTKALIQKLHDTNNPLYDKIDKIIFVAVPQVGTPDSVADLLYGTNIGPKGFIMNEKTSRKLAENMPAVYNFLPSASYFTTVDPGFTADTLISFESKPFFSAQTSLYGFFVSTITELKNYILGTDGRTKPSTSDVKNPNIGNEILYQQAEAVHQVLDSWTPLSETKVIQVAGWGEETLAGLDYVVLKGGNTEYLSFEPRWVVDGDGTVVVPSALWMPASSNVERWWVDLRANDTIDNIERVHKDIFEVSNLLNFIKYKITGATSFDNPNNVILSDDATLISNKTRLHFTLHSPLTLGILDSEGHYTGMDPITREIKEEISDVIYRQIGDVQYLSVPFNVAYTVKLQGYAEGYFTLDVDKQVGNNITETISLEGIQSSAYTVATMDIIPDYQVSSSKIKVDKEGDGSIDKTYQIVDGEMKTTNLRPIPGGSSSYSSTGATYIAIPVIEQPTVKTIQDIAQIIEKAEEKNEEKTPEEVQEKGITETKAPEPEEAKETGIPIQDSSLSATAVNSGVGSPLVPYVIIIGVIALSFLVRMFMV